MTSSARSTPLRSLCRALACAAALLASGARADAPAAAPSTTAPAADAGVATAPVAKKPLDEAAALKKVLALAEVRAVEAELRRAKLPMAVRRDDDGTPGPMQFAVAEDHPDHLVTRYRFSVEPATGAVAAYEVICDAWTPLSKWRAAVKKRAALPAAERDDFDLCGELSK